MIACFSGSRDYKNLNRVTDAIRTLWQYHPPHSDITIIHGGARGVDSFVDKCARDFGFSVQVFPANWKKYGRSAGAIRNKQMAKIADRLYAFWDGKSRGTKMMIDLFTKMNKPVYHDGDR